MEKRLEKLIRKYKKDTDLLTGALCDEMDEMSNEDMVLYADLNLLTYLIQQTNEIAGTILDNHSDS